ncbi:serine/threonine-protein kinase-like protein At3g51990 [Typha angustifolia]|uniref:serine/threonine-protein kinase-like protein At3g51990 n=1 Tax=Typha angustifolia TaxID=59011 RepID=UPI003C2EB479
MGYLSCRADSSVATCRSISSVSAHAVHSKRASQEAGGEDSAAVATIHRFSYGELESATSNFSDSHLLGRGSHGAVYKAVLPVYSPHPVAVKRPSRRPSTPIRDEVENEIEILSSIRNPRLVNLLGFSNSTSKEVLLVVEFMPNGTLFDLLHSNPNPPGWPRRVRLALQTAKALLVLHSARPPVIHRDVKSANVLLDRHFHARLADFGLAIQAANAGLSTPPAGTLGYLDPSYVTPENLSTKTDVFSFGILLLEIMSGRKAIDVAHSPPSVVEWAVPLLKKGKVAALYDPRIAPMKDAAIRRQLASLAASCVRGCKERRPSMAEVVVQLEGLSKTVSSRRAWSGFPVVGNPCAVVDIERTVSKSNVLEEPTNADVAEEDVMVSVKKGSRPLRNAKVFSEGGTRERRNLKELLARFDEEPKRRSDIRRARTLRVASHHGDKNGEAQLWRNNTLRGVPSELFSRSDGFERLNGKLHSPARDLP